MRQWLIAILLATPFYTHAAQVHALLLATQLGLQTVSLSTSAAEIGLMHKLMRAIDKNHSSEACGASCEWSSQKIKEASFFWFALPALGMVGSALGATASAIALLYHYTPYTSHRLHLLSVAVSGLVVLTSLADFGTKLGTLVDAWGSYPVGVRNAFEWAAGLSVYPLAASALAVSIAGSVYAIHHCADYFCTNKRQYIELRELPASALKI